MKFACVVPFKSDDPRIPDVRPHHRQYLTDLTAQGKLVLSGPFPESNGALIVLEVATAEDAEAILKADPYTKAGVFTTWTIKPWKILFINRDLLADPIS
jgi:uncharacterized protein YciI